MNVLQIVQRFADVSLLNHMGSLAGGGSEGRQYLALINIVLEDIYQRDFTSDMIYNADDVEIPVGGYSLLDLPNVTSLDDFRCILADTVRTQDEELRRWKQSGIDSDWLRFKSQSIQYLYRIRRGLLEVSQPPVKLSFSYALNCLVLEAGSVLKRYATLDSDTFLIPDSVIYAGLAWRWRMQAGLTYEAEYATYERSYSSYKAARSEARTIRTDSVMVDTDSPFDAAIFGKVGN